MGRIVAKRGNQAESDETGNTASTFKPGLPRSLLTIFGHFLRSSEAADLGQRDVRLVVCGSIIKGLRSGGEALTVALRPRPACPLRRSSHGGGPSRTGRTGPRFDPATSHEVSPAAVGLLSALSRFRRRSSNPLLWLFGAPMFIGVSGTAVPRTFPSSPGPGTSTRIQQGPCRRE